MLYGHTFYDGRLLWRRWSDLLGAAFLGSHKKIHREAHYISQAKDTFTLGRFSVEKSIQKI